MVPDIAVIDYGVGNLLSVKRAFEYLGAKVKISSDPDVILAATHVVLPGVGAFPNAIKKLETNGLDLVVKEVASSGTALLAICLGMQLLMQESDEFGLTAGLALVPGRVEAIPEFSISGEDLKVPHIGWNALRPESETENWKETILQEVNIGDFVYFVHSFMVKPTHSSNILAEALHGGHKIAAVISKDNIVGCQFHPEKSGENGLKILRRFIS
jgi:glutamine amidotransferase